MKLWCWIFLLVLIVVLVVFGWYWIVEDLGYVLVCLCGWCV